jgi:hypothetical protein
MKKEQRCRKCGQIKLRRNLMPKCVDNSVHKWIAPKRERENMALPI